MKRQFWRKFGLLLCLAMVVQGLIGCGTGDQQAEIYVEPVKGIEDDFIRGMDASSVLSVENSGAKYYGFDGNEQDVFQTLAESGVNYIRLRVWNDPYDENGNGYGGGNNDVETAIELGKRATKYGMKVSIDFHYSDFWADPKRQHAPKAWEGMDIEEKSEALYGFLSEENYSYFCRKRPSGLLSFLQRYFKCLCRLYMQTSLWRRCYLLCRR